MKHWLIKSEPSAYSYERLAREKKTTWDGVTNPEALKNLRSMSAGDLLLFYHSSVGKAVVGVAKVLRAAPEDAAIEVGPVAALNKPVTLEHIKTTKSLSSMVVAKRSRLSVTPVTPAEFRAVLAAGETKI